MKRPLQVIADNECVRVEQICELLAAGKLEELSYWDSLNVFVLKYLAEEINEQYSRIRSGPVQ